MWKTSPEVLGVGNMYKKKLTNRFNMDMFQVTGVTDQKTVANFVFGLVNTEKEVGYSILCEHLERLRRQLDILAPMVDGSGHIAVEIRVFDILDIINAISVWFSPSVVDV